MAYLKTIFKLYFRHSRDQESRELGGKMQLAVFRRFRGYRIGTAVVLIILSALAGTAVDRLSIGAVATAPVRAIPPVIVAARTSSTLPINSFNETQQGMRQEQLDLRTSQAAIRESSLVNHSSDMPAGYRSLRAKQLEWLQGAGD